MTNCMKLIVNILYYTGFWSASQGASEPWSALYIFARIQLARMAYGACVQSYNLYLDWGVIGRMIEYVTFLVIDVRLFIQIYILIYRHGELASIVHYLREKQELHSAAHDPEQRRIVSKINWVTHIMTIVLNAAMGASLVGVAVILGAYGMEHREVPFSAFVKTLCLDFYLCTARFLNLQKCVKQAIIKWFPFDIFYTPVFEIILWTLMVTQIWDMLLMTFFDVLFIAINIQVIGQFALLNWKLSNLHGLVYDEIHRRLEAELFIRKLKTNEDHNSKTKSKSRKKTKGLKRNRKGMCDPPKAVVGKEPDHQFLAKFDEKNLAEERFLRKCVQHHNELVGICDVVGSLFHTSHIAQMTQNALTCLAVIYITDLSHDFDAKVAVEAALIFACCIEFFMFCVLGTALQHVSTDLAFSAYSSNWVGLSKSMKTSLQIIMTRALKGVEFKAFSVFPVTVDTYVAVLKFSYSVYAVLDTVSSVPENEVS